MRPLPQILLDAQKASMVKPAMIINVGDVAFRTAGATTGNTTTCHNTNTDSLKWVRDEGGRILKVVEKGNPYSHTCKIILNNYDKLLYDLTLKGQRLSIGWGVETWDGPMYSHTPTLYVKTQTFVESEGAMQCVLECKGVMDLLGEDEATESYVDDGTTCVGDLITAVLEATLAPYEDCKAYIVILDDDLDDLWTGVYLGDSFEIKKGDTRAYTIARLLDMTRASIRVGNEPPDENNKDTVHFFTQSRSPQAEFTLDRSGHRFYVAAESLSMITPNEIIIKTPPWQSPSYLGRARDAYSYNLNPCSRTEYVSGVGSNLQAGSIASTMLQKIIAANSGSSAVLPMHCGLDLFDRIKVVSKRSGREIEGAIGGWTRTFDPVKSEPRYDIGVSFGKWFDPRRDDDSLGYGYGFLGSDIDEVVSGSGHISIHINAPYAVSGEGDWAVHSFGCGPTIATGVNEVWVSYKFAGSGAYKLTFMSAAGSSAGILDILVDDVEVGSFDMFGTPGAFLDAKQVSFECGSGTHTIKFLVDGKNESSGGYAIILGGAELALASYVGTVI